MAVSKDNTLYVRMFGGFSMICGGKEIVLGRNSAGKFIQLVQLVWLDSETGISKRQLMRSLYENESLSNSSNSFNNLIYQMRKQMVRAGMPDADYVKKKDKVFIPDPEVPIWIDVHEFRECVAIADESNDVGIKLDNYRKAFALYQNELLPELSNEIWVVTESVSLRRMYNRCVVWLGQYYKGIKDYNNMFKVYSKAADIYPDADWQVCQIDALLCMEEYKEAYKLYDKAVRFYTEELGVSPSKELLECYQRMSQKISYEPGKLSQIQDEIQEYKDEELGAYFCSYPSFIDAYHILSRNMIRSGRSIYMMLCTIVDYEGKPIRNTDKLHHRSDDLRAVIGETLRGSDTFCKYTDSQYLILLVGTSIEGCELVARRITKNLKEVAGPRADVRCNSVSLADISDGKFKHTGE